MCQILIQRYACEHQKPICITPCARAQVGGPPTPPKSPFHIARRPLTPRPPSSASPPPTPGSGSTHSSLSPPNPPRWLTLLPSYDPRTQYCPTFFPHNTSRSSWPCVQCYLRPEWTEYRRRWAKKYQIDHPEVGSEDVDVLAGISLIPERLGIVNVVNEVDRINSLRAARSVQRRNFEKNEGKDEAGSLSPGG